MGEVEWSHSLRVECDSIGVALPTPKGPVAQAPEPAPSRQPLHKIRFVPGEVIVQEEPPPALPSPLTDYDRYAWIARRALGVQRAGKKVLLTSTWMGVEPPRLVKVAAGQHLPGCPNPPGEETVQAALRALHAAQAAPLVFQTRTQVMLFDAVMSEEDAVEYCRGLIAGGLTLRHTVTEVQCKASQAVKESVVSKALARQGSPILDVYALKGPRLEPARVPHTRASTPPILPLRPCSADDHPVPPEDVDPPEEPPPWEMDQLERDLLIEQELEAGL